MKEFTRQAGLWLCLVALMVSLPALAQEPQRESKEFFSNVITMGDILATPQPAESVHADIELIRGLAEGTATITANVTITPANLPYSLQWQNNLSGEFRDVPGETGHTITFPATEENLKCMWRVTVTANP